MEEETKKIEFSNRVFILVAVLVAGIVISYLGQMMYQFRSLPQNSPQEIIVAGEGKVFVKPDVALVALGVKTEAKKSIDAINQNNERMNAVIKTIKDLGVNEKDIRTSVYNLFPVYDYTETGRVFIGYSLDQQVVVKIRDFDKINDILDQVTTVGANIVGDLQFTLDDPEGARAGARVKAVEQAKVKAFTLVNQAGLKIVKLVNVSEGHAPSPQPVYMMSGAEKAGVAPDIQPGQSEINTTVYLTYRVR